MEYQEKSPFIKNSLNKLHSIFNPYKKRKKKIELELEIKGEKYLLATFNRRLFATTIDAIILSLLMMPCSYIMMLLGLNEKITKIQFDAQFISSANDISGLIGTMYASGVLLPYIIVQAILLVVMILYFVIFWYKKGATPGKILMKCMIIDSTTGTNITISQSFLRIIGYIASLMTLFIGLFMIDFTKKRQGLHDKIASTLVIVKR